MQCSPLILNIIPVTENAVRGEGETDDLTKLFEISEKGKMFIILIKQLSQGMQVMDLGLKLRSWGVWI